MFKFSELTLYRANVKILAYSLKFSQTVLKNGNFKSIYEPEIQDEAFYHGYLKKAQANIYLKQHGQFLIRKINENNDSVNKFIRCFLINFFL